VPASNLLTAQLRAGGADAETAKDEIRKALRAANGAILETAEVLGLSDRSVRRLLALAELQEEAARLRAAAGLHDPLYKPLVGETPKRAAKRGSKRRS
jgi:hypothetical protein